MRLIVLAQLFPPLDPGEAPRFIFATVLIVGGFFWFMWRQNRRCPHCRAKISAKASQCRYCQREVTPKYK